METEDKENMGARPSTRGLQQHKSAAAAGEGSEDTVMLSNSDRLRQRLQNMQRRGRPAARAADDGEATVKLPGSADSGTGTGTPTPSMSPAQSQKLLRSLSDIGVDQWNQLLAEQLSAEPATWLSFIQQAEAHVTGEHSAQTPKLDPSSVLRLYRIATESLPKTLYRTWAPYEKLWVQYASWQLKYTEKREAKQTLKYLFAEGLGGSIGTLYTLMAEVETKPGGAANRKVESVLRKGIAKCPASEHAAIHAAWVTLLGVPYVAGDDSSENHAESLAQLMTLLEGSGQLPHQLEATKTMLQQMGEDTSAIDADIATATARIVRAEAGQGGHVPEQTAPNYLISIADVKVGPRIGRGALGEVLLGEYDSTRVALKGLHMLRTDEASQAEWGGALSAAERARLLDDFKRECDTMRGLVHENILPFIGVVVDSTPIAEPLYLAMQFIESGTLHDMLHAAKYAGMRSDSGCLPLETQLTVFVGMFSGLAFLAEKRLIHRDIKPANILAVVEGSRLIKVLLADFGESKQLTATMTRVAGTAAGTPLYMAPEMGEEDDAKGPKADVFSAGVVLIETNTGQIPNPGPAKRKEGRRRVDIPEEERRAADLAAVRHPEVRELASRCIVDYDEERADAAEMLARCLVLGGEDAPVRSSSIFMVNISSRQRIRLDVNATTTVNHLKRQAAARMDLPRASVVDLIFCGRKMEDQRTVDDYNLLDGTVVHVLPRG